jgi:hypothetical protein
MFKKTVFFTALALASFAHADSYMSADEVKALMNDKTFDGVYLAKDKNFSAYEAPDGTHHVLRPSGKRDKGRTWFVNDKGQHCTTNPKWKKKWPDGRCSYVKDAGSGEYHKFSDKGKHTHTLSNFREGNKL